MFKKYKKLNIGTSKRRFSLAGWETVDIGDADHIVNFRRDKLPFADNSCSLIYSSHLIEHLTDDVAMNLLSEVHRVLRSKGVFRLACPDLELVIKAYQEDNLDFFFQNPITRMFLIKGVNNGKLSKESLLLHNNVVRTLASYTDTGEGPIVEKTVFEQKIKPLDKYEFAKWCVSMLDKNRMKENQPWGHINAFDYVKVKAMLSKAGFREIEKSSFGKSRISGIRRNGLDLERHKWFSLYVEATK